MSVFLGFVKTWVKLPSSALILQFDVLSLVSWIAGLPSVSNVLSEYFPSLGWTLSWPTVVQESYSSPVALSECFQCTVRVLSFFGLNSFLTYCCAGELQFASCTVRVLCFFGLNSFLTCCCAGELQFASCTEVPPGVLFSVFFQGVASVVKSISSSSGLSSHSSLYSRLYKVQTL